MIVLDFNFNYDLLQDRLMEASDDVSYQSKLIISCIKFVDQKRYLI